MPKTQKFDCISKQTKSKATQLILIAQTLAVSNGDINMHKPHQLHEQMTKNDFEDTHKKLQPYINSMTGF